MRRSWDGMQGVLCSAHPPARPLAPRVGPLQLAAASTPARALGGCRVALLLAAPDAEVLLDRVERVLACRAKHGVEKRAARSAQARIRMNELHRRAPRAARERAAKKKSYAAARRAQARSEEEDEETRSALKR